MVQQLLTKRIIIIALPHYMNNHQAEKYSEQHTNCCIIHKLKNNKSTNSLLELLPITTTFYFNQPLFPQWLQPQNGYYLELLEQCVQ